MENQCTTVTKRLDDHSDRLRSLEIDRGVSAERHNSLMGILKELKDSFDGLILKIEKGYVTKESLEILIKDGKYRSLWVALVSAASTFIILGLIGIFIPFDKI